MKKTIGLLSVLLALALTLSSAAYASEVEKDAGYISVNSSATREIAPNQAEITVRVETSDKVMQKASEENKIIADKVYSSIKGILDKGGYIKTSNYSARKSYIYKDGKNIFDKFIVSNDIVVRTKNVGLVSKIIDTAIAHGATTVGNVAFSAVDYDSISNEVLCELTKKAYAQANVVAAAANAKVVGVKSINANCNSENRERVGFGMMAAMSDSVAKASVTPIESGKIRLYATVEASFYVAP